VIEPLGECWDDMKIAIELVKKTPWANRHFIPWNSCEELYEWMVKGMGTTFADFKQKGYIIEPMKYKKYLDTGFNTPTKKVELYSTIFEQCGYDPLPTYHEPPQSPLSTPELLVDYPLILITGGRHLGYFHSEGRQIASLRKLVPDPQIEIHPTTAHELNIKEGDWIWIETPQVACERARFKAKLTTDIHPNVVHARHGWWFPEKPAPEHGCFDSNINVVITGGLPREPICGSVPTRGTLCKIYK
jgi:anaerobic selenocysteine-containing dehydrogenase